MAILIELVIILISTLALLMAISHYRSHKSRDRCDAPEAEGGWPIFGHLLLFSSKDLMHKKLGSMADKYGPIFTIRIGSHREIVVSSWEVAKECFTVHDKAFADRPLITAARLMGYNGAMFSISPYGEYWRQVRKIVMIELLSNRRLDSLKHTQALEVETAIKDLVKVWIDKGRPRSGVLVEMKSWLGDLMVNITLKMVGGKSYRGLTTDNNTEARRCKRSIGRFFDLFMVFLLSDAVPALGWLDLGGHERSMKETAKELDIILQGWLEEHRRKRLSRPEGGREPDFMDLLLNVIEGANFSDFDADTVIKATCLKMIIAGTNTITTALMWALLPLVNNRRALKKAQQELDTYVGKSIPMEESNVKKSTYLQAIVKETLRLYTPVPIALRSCTEECTFSAGFRIPTGTRLPLPFNIAKIQRDERVWSNPNEFQPERFLMTHENVDMRGQNFELIPFSTGRRSCAGTSLALHMLHLVLASLLQSFEISTVSDEAVDMMESPALSNMKTTPLEIIIILRLDQKVYERDELENL
ncbi:hypothetical protein ACJRO7_030883 [Eucalyptus globulus]|uniref:Cytochrome P450 n=1 Tax=Eucalyptus globulus TaxID=34317 RepID=A0ABD3JF30_EUCGL